MFIDIIEIDTFISFSSFKKINAFEIFYGILTIDYRYLDLEVLSNIFRLVIKSLSNLSEINDQKEKHDFFKVALIDIDTNL